MPTRILREGIITSEPVNSLSESAELFYRRLMTVADDYGRYYAHPSLLRAACYPLKLDSISEKYVRQVLSECQRAGVICVYGDGKYLFIPKFSQRTRSPSKFPQPSEVQTLSTCPSNANHLRSDAETDAETKAYAYSAASRSVLHILNQECGRHYRETEDNLKLIEQRLKEPEVTVEGIKQMIVRQCARWKGTEYEEYLRPATLFAKSKFDGYYAGRESRVQPNGGSSKPNPRNVGTIAGKTDFAAASRRLQCSPSPDVAQQVAPAAGGSLAN